MPPRYAVLLVALGALEAHGAARNKGGRAPASPSPRATVVPEKLVRVGCFADDEQRDLGQAAWQAALQRGLMSQEQCARTCVGTAWFALQRGLCQCASSVSTAPQYGRRPDAECKGDAMRNAVYARSACPLGATFQMQDELGASEDGARQWKARVSMARWQEGLRLTLDWGAMPVTIY